MDDIVVVSDLHLGRGKNAKTGRYYRLEAFFYDDDFCSFCNWLCEDAKTREESFVLVLNGDTFDLLRIEPEQSRAGASLRERRFGPTMTPTAAGATISDILEGHPRFVAGISQILAAGHSVVFIAGNHDPELQWRNVQDAVRSKILVAVTEQFGAETATGVSDQLTFSPWFYYEPGRIWIEHGNQYDSENAFAYPLREALGDAPESLHRAENDVPLGTFFQRYLYNGFGNITFIVPSGRANMRYFRWLLLNKPRLLARIATKHLPFFVQVLRRIAKTGASTVQLREAHEQVLVRLATESGLGDRLLSIDAAKRAHGSVAVVVRTVISQVLKALGFSFLLIAIVLGLWFAGFDTISEMRAGTGLKATLFLALNLFFLFGAIMAIAYFLVRPSRAPPLRPMRQAAQHIADELGVPIVSFGHTHDEMVWRLKHAQEARWYYNTGTWVAVFTHDELLPRERVQYTFLRVKDRHAELMHYSPGRREAIPVILIDDEHRVGDFARPPEQQPS